MSVDIVLISILAGVGAGGIVWFLWGLIQTTITIRKNKTSGKPGA